MATLTSLHRLTQVSLILLIFLSPLLAFTGNTTNETPQDLVQIAADEPLNIILMVGDGMGYEHVELARLVEAGVSGFLAMQNLTWNSTSLTHSANSAITDSAAGATAFSTGNKTNNGYIAVNTSGVALETILEYAQMLNKSTGVVTTATLYHATPASFMTHVNDRYQYSEITRQIVEEAAVDVLLGGGNTEFSAGSNKITMESNGYSIVYNQTALAAHTSGKILGLFTNGYMNYEQDRNIAIEPSILEMTSKSLELLSQDPDGFFLIVEGGRIDHAGHAGNKVNAALDAIAFNEAVQLAVDYVDENNNTILIVTADHETGGLAIVSQNLSSELPGDLLTEPEKRALRIERANNVTVTWSTTSHTNTSVPIYCFGSMFSEFPENTTIDNTEIFTIMKDYFDGTYLEPETTDSVAPTIETAADDLIFTEGDSDQFLTWQVSDLDPGVYVIERNDTEVFTDSWNDSIDVVYNVTDTPVGTWMFNITFFDGSSNNVSDIAYVTVNAVTTTTTTTTTTFTTVHSDTTVPNDPILYTILLSGAALVVVVVFIIVRKR